MEYTDDAQVYRQITPINTRVPVRITLTKDNDPKQIALLRAGLNVETKVRIK